MSSHLVRRGASYVPSWQEAKGNPAEDDAGEKSQRQASAETLSSNMGHAIPSLGLNANPELRGRWDITSNLRAGSRT